MMACAVTVAVSLPSIAVAETLMLANSDAIGSPIDRMNIYFKEQVEARSGGDLTVNYIPGEQLGSAPQVMDQVSAGTVEAFGNSAAWITPYAGDAQVLTWGFTFRNADHMQAFFDGPLFASITKDMQDVARIRVLAAAPLESRILFAGDPIGKPSDIEGRKMRVPQIDAYLRFWSAVGTQPTQVPWGEVFLALSTGVVDMAEGPAGAGFSQRFHEAAPNVYLTNHLYATTMFAINEDKFQSLTPEYQALVTDVAREATLWIRQEAEEGGADVLARMESEGAVVKPFDAEPLRELALGEVEKMEQEGVWRPGLYQEIQDIAD
jgi:TRAP-type C4-dicarboxylate transport system substrate-binding protein